jgi:hypothetical protein
LAITLASFSASAMKVTSTPDFDLNIQVLLQPRFQGDFDGVPGSPTSTAPDGPSPTGTFNADLFIKRARLVARGTAFKYFQFLVTLDTPNFGVRGNYGFVQNNTTFIQDLVATAVPVKDFWIDFGFLLVPLSHGSVSNPAAQSAIDAPGSILAGRLMNNASRASREAGLQIRTLLLDHRILLRGGVYEGARSSQGVPAPGPNDPILNPNGRPMVGGMVRFNLVGDEVTFPGYMGIYMDGKSRVSVGVGGQWQSKAAVGANVTGAAAYPDYLAAAADVFMDIALPAETEVIFQLNGYRFDYGAGNARTGYGAAGEIGYRIGRIEPQFNAYWFNSDSKNASMLKWAAGVNYFFKGHDAKISLEFDGLINGGYLPTAPTPTPTLHQIVLQGQLAF